MIETLIFHKINSKSGLHVFWWRGFYCLIWLRYDWSTSMPTAGLAAFQAHEYKLPCRVYEADKNVSLHLQFSGRSLKFGSFISLTGSKVQFFISFTQLQCNGCLTSAVLLLPLQKSSTTVKSIHWALAKLKCSFVPRAMLSRLTWMRVKLNRHCGSRSG